MITRCKSGNTLTCGLLLQAFVKMAVKTTHLASRTHFDDHPTNLLHDEVHHESLGHRKRGLVRQLGHVQDNLL